MLDGAAVIATVATTQPEVGMTRVPRLTNAFGVLAAVVLSTAVTAPQEHAAAEQEAFAAVSRAVAALEDADERGALIQAAAQVATVVDQVRDAFAVAEHTREAAAYRAAHRSALAVAVTCDNGFPCTNDGLDRFEGLADALVRHLQLIAAVSFANAAYLDAAGVAAADQARSGGTRIRRLAARLRNVNASEAMDRWNALLGQEEIDVTSGLHAEARQAHEAARRVVLESTDPLLAAVAAAATRGPAADGASGAVLAAAQASARALRASLSADTGAGYRAAVTTDAGAEPPAPPDRAVVAEAVAGGRDGAAAARAAVGAAAGSAGAGVADAFPALDRGRRPAADVPRPADADAEPEATETADGAATEAADVGAVLAALDRAFAADAPVADVPRPAGTDAEPEATEAAGVAALAALDGAFAAANATAANASEQEDAADAASPALADATAAEVAGEPEPTILTAWLRAVNAAVRRAEEAAAEAEKTAAATGSWFSLTTACLDARDRVSKAGKRVKELTIGEARPLFVTSAAGSEAYCEVEDRLEAANERGRLACDSIEQPR